jgi:hypothetical protein
LCVQMRIEGSRGTGSVAATDPGEER